MGQRTDQIEDQIESRREDLKSNLQELETRVKSATDWRHYFRENTGMMIAAAIGGGVLLSTLMRQRSVSAPVRAAAEGVRTATSGAKHEALKTFDTITSALVGAAATKFKGVLGDVVPGFSEHLAQTESERSRDSTH
jgi:hypothetical protein